MRSVSEGAREPLAAAKLFDADGFIDGGGKQDDAEQKSDGGQHEDTLLSAADFLQERTCFLEIECQLKILKTIEFI